MSKNTDLDVSGDFKILNFSEPPNEKNADLDVSEDFKIFKVSGTPQNRFGWFHKFYLYKFLNFIYSW